LILSVILSILKTIGIICLWIIGIILILILLILFFPVCYKGSAAFQGQPQADIRAWWLFHFVRFRFLLKPGEKEPSAEARVLWFRVWKLNGENRETDTEEEPEPESDTEEKAENPEPVREEEEGPSENKFYSGTVIQKPESAAESGTEPKGRKIRRKGKKPEKQKEPEKQKVKITERIRKIFGNIKDKWNSLNDKRKAVTGFLKDERNKKLFRFLKKRVKRILKCILPKKLQGTVKFGFDDPYTTGQVLSYAALLLPFYHDKLKVVPVFENKTFSADVSFKGRIFLIVLLVNGLQIWLNRDFRRILKKFRR